METFSVTVKNLSEKLLQRKTCSDLGEVIENLFREIVTLDTSIKLHDSQLEEIAIQLWNWAVTKRVGSAITEEQKAQVRHVACILLSSFGPANPSESIVRKLILMGIKTGRTWLDCKQTQLADPFLSMALSSLEILYGKLTSHGNPDDINTPKGDIEKDLLRVLSYQAESAVSQEQHQVAVSCMQRCKEILLRLPKETGYLSLICYNFGVDTRNQGKHEESIFWLSQSYDIGKMNVKFSPGSEMQAKVLRLLATVYLEWDSRVYLEKALHAVSLANKEHMQVSGLFLKVCILVKGGSSDSSVKSALAELLDCEVALEVEVVGFDFLKRVCQRFESSPNLGSALLMHIELLLQRNKELLAKQKIEDAITGHYAGKQLSAPTLTSLHILLWDRASKNVEAKNFSEALQWYDYSLSFYKAGELDPNLAKLQRNRSSCFLNLHQLEKAKEAVEEAARIDPSNIFTQFNIFRFAVLENNAEKAGEALREIATMAEALMSSDERVLVTENAAANLLGLAAQIALEHEQQETAIKALESLCEHSQDVAQILNALRCLVRLVLSTMENSNEELRNASLDMLLSYLKTALQNLSKVKHIHCPGTEQQSEDANWFRRIAWNSALQCEHSPVRMRDFFILSFQTALLIQTLEHIQLCKEIWTIIKAAGTSPNDKTDSLMVLYEFEARAKLNDPKLESVLESALELDHVETKLLEMIAALAMEPPAFFPLVCKKALKIALCLHKKQPEVNFISCSNCLRSLIQLTLPDGASEVQACVLEELWSYYEEALSIIASAHEDIPELEILWLLTRAWNTGILLYSLAHYPEAERWCGLYSEVLDRLDKAKKSLITEVRIGGGGHRNTPRWDPVLREP
ncbi:hypothetical protein DNTS_000294 [Danionella cerebrum]|uniref:Protein ZIP4 homolog n=1 Tax=Danionella cerebrum TaxID=2873325 RepID=A0A553R718_9TELE|nr:hypothetical protein DNTS_000294 [Danionella translucida]